MKQKKSWISGSITVEAALVVPVFILAVYAFLYFFCILQVQEDLHYAASRSCELISSYGGMLKDILTEDEDIKEAGVDKTLLNEAKKQLMDSVTLKLLVSAKMEHLYLADACIEKGLSGVSFFGSSLSDSEGCVTVVMSYYIRIPLAGFGQLRYPVIQRVSIRNFSGHYVASRLTKQEGQGGEENAGDPIVYITKNGTVYHMTSACTYIRRSVSSVLYSRIEEKRNENEAKYYPCESCCKNGVRNPGTVVYITSYGKRYHSSSECSQIERNVIEKRLSEVQGMRPCSKCGKTEE